MARIPAAVPSIIHLDPAIPGITQSISDKHPGNVRQVENVRNKGHVHPCVPAHRRRRKYAQRRIGPVSQSEWEVHDVRIFGMHIGYRTAIVSYAYLMEELGRLDPAATKGRVILAHLGNGASLAAVL